ncbi:hypothetical protein GUITHDRAFT_120591 [Guillardia theta CCMP2712]|uniref:Uncharacterized protein n=1 Tax=Guillardia theta (strain CCMP2712) TaxID=905079 RepID=L1IAD5_GUITC|nr:hypothetical protein GUITHDRAFT_120591 [Guillardia theta CCMP2712]EKX33226.1 hypothetical protein GUITHDRAFT_120591 [Guillardia theta CCMP2712]|eukprot:XP_005820206.1 hypothetical protein GUITHDRAFT_120591 [Guillardia theta CCMP2712]
MPLLLSFHELPFPFTQTSKTSGMADHLNIDKSTIERLYHLRQEDAARSLVTRMYMAMECHGNASKSWDMEPVEPEQNMAPLDMAWVQWYLQIDEFGPVTAERNDFQKYFINLQPMQTVE